MFCSTGVLPYDLLTSSRLALVINLHPTFRLGEEMTGFDDNCVTVRLKFYDNPQREARMGVIAAATGIKLRRVAARGAAPYCAQMSPRKR